MKRHWLRGVMLGLSMALLLAGGAALAQGLYVMADQPCFTCAYRADGWPPPADHIVTLTIGGYPAMDWMCARLTMDGMVWGSGCWAPHVAPPCTVELAVECTSMQLMMVSDCWGDIATALGGDVGPAEPDAVYGEWVWRQWSEEVDDGNGAVTAGPVTAKFTFAETCEEEFVPEPGTMMLLGSGLAGLAGYATLRWRTRE